jgi:hypothetical protein
MWLTKNGVQKINDVRTNNWLTEEELEAVKTYDGFEEARALNHKQKSPGSVLICQLQDILKKYANYTDPLETPD